MGLKNLNHISDELWISLDSSSIDGENVKEIKKNIVRREKDKWEKKRNFKEIGNPYFL